MIRSYAVPPPPISFNLAECNDMFIPRARTSLYTLLSLKPWLRGMVWFRLIFIYLQKKEKHFTLFFPDKDPLILKHSTAYEEKYPKSFMKCTKSILSGSETHQPTLLID